jgi:hypothetical protein
MREATSGSIGYESRLAAGIGNAFLRGFFEGLRAQRAFQFPAGCNPDTLAAFPVFAWHTRRVAADLPPADVVATFLRPGSSRGPTAVDGGAPGGQRRRDFKTHYHELSNCPWD